MVSKTYLEWILRQVFNRIPCGLARHEIVALTHYAAKALQPDKGGKYLVEIGSWQGGSAVPMGLVCKKLNRGKVVTIDPHGNTVHHKRVKIKSTLRIIKKNINKYGVEEYVRVVSATSAKAFKKYRKIKVSLVFIDADHRYQAVRRDFLMWSKVLVNGGFLLLHDTLNMEGPRRVMMEILINKHFAYIGNVGDLACFRKKEKLSVRNQAKKIYARLVYKMLFVRIYTPLVS